MRHAKLSLLSSAVALTLAVAMVPGIVQAQPDGRPGPSGRRAEEASREVREIRLRIREAGERIERGERRGRLNDREARRLRRELREVRDLEARMSRDGWVDRREREELSSRVQELHRHVTKEIRD
ncbi:hypothetical protein FN976_27695 [Caenimonas sedimenti]|uniref:Uncharacterized protein n=1 Tax=Caenimonas sedimenti TaxID=2596921 RepID=A0A562ZEN1_9BURK|nr:hypothetical protein [Caenimonas sedimenti]TWO64889.1 hypothetical protein FN976_27695 [Caenimonas sedimenti]